MSGPEFQTFGKIARWNREIVVTEKLDGTNACVIVTEDGDVHAQSRNRIITVDDDNYGFALFVRQNVDELRNLGPGYHFGEWWGVGINRGYALHERRFSLFNVGRWNEDNIPACCHVVPVLDTLTSPRLLDLDATLDYLRIRGSLAAPGFLNPEGIVIFHKASGQLFKVTLERDEVPKGAV